MAVFQNIYRHGMARIAAFAPRVALADPKANAEAIIALAGEADAERAAAALFPELALTGYSLDDLHHQAPLLDAAEAAARALIEASRYLMPVIVVGCPVRAHSQLFNCALVIHRGRLLGVVPKTYLPNYREYYEKRWFAAAPDAQVETIDFAGETAPFGAEVIFEAEDAPGLGVHVEICEDLWAPHPPSIDGALAGATVTLNLSASNVTIEPRSSSPPAPTRGVDRFHIIESPFLRAPRGGTLIPTPGFGYLPGLVAPDDRTPAPPQGIHG